MKKQLFTLVLFLLIGGLSVQAQVKFKISYDKMSDRYTISIIPEATYELPNNLTGTAQISIKAPTGKFAPVDIKNLYPGFKWEYNSRSDAPEEASEYDYISFGLENPGLLHLPYKEGFEIPLLSFKNEFGCSCEVELVKNERDIFMAPNSKNVNIGNSISILGYGVNAYNGVVGDGKANCLTTYTHNVNGIIRDFDLYPIPTDKDLFLEFTWGGKGEQVMAQIIDELGRVHQARLLDFIPGDNRIAFNVSNLAASNYFLKLKGEDWEETLDKFQKIRQ